MCRMANKENCRAAPRTAGGNFSFKRLIPVFVLLAGLILFFALGLNHYVTFEALREHRASLLDLVGEHAILAPLAYLIIYAAAVAFSLPGGAVMSIAAGFLFGTLIAMGTVIVAATLGATILFIIAKTALGDPLRAKAGPWMNKCAGGFQDNALSYLLFLRLIPLFPFFVVNLVPAFLGVRLSTYVIGTFFGIIPGAFVFCTVGAGIGGIFDSGADFTIKSVLTPQIITALAGLAVLALLPIAYKKWKAKKS